MYLYSFASAYPHTLWNFLFISAIAQFWLCYSIVCNRLLSTHKHTWSIRYLNQCVSLECVRACVSHSFCIFRKFGFLLANLRLHVITIAYYIYIYFDLFILCSFYSFVRSLVDVALHSFLFHLPLCIHNTQTYKIYMHVSYICYHREKKRIFSASMSFECPNQYTQRSECECVCVNCRDTENDRSDTIHHRGANCISCVYNNTFIE